MRWLTRRAVGIWTAWKGARPRSQIRESGQAGHDRRRWDGGSCARSSDEEGDAMGDNMGVGTKLERGLVLGSLRLG